MKFRHKKIKREHSIIKGALDWLEDLSKKREVTDIIPGVIDVTNSKERGIVYKYETSTGCKLFMKNGGSIQEVFVVTKNPEVVEAWVLKMMDELSFFEAALDHQNLDKEGAKKEESERPKTRPKPAQKNKTIQPEETLMSKRDPLLTGIKEDYQLVEINKGLRDSLVESLASMADHETPTIEDVINPSTRDALENLQENLNQKRNDHRGQPPAKNKKEKGKTNSRLSK